MVTLIARRSAAKIRRVGKMAGKHDLPMDFTTNFTTDGRRKEGEMGDRCISNCKKV